MKTTVTLATGRQVDVQGTYEDVTAYLAGRKLVEDDGRRTLTLTDGRKMTVATAGILAVEEAREVEKRTIGFR